MKLIDIIEKMILSYPTGDPIFNKDVAWAASEKTGLPLNTVAAYVSAAFRRLIDKGEKIKHFEKGVYYRYDDCLFGETVLNKCKLITQKYLKDNTGYETGPMVLHTMGFTTLMSNSPRVFVSNAAMRRSFLDKKLNVRLLKPKAILNENNIHYFQFLDIVKLLDEIPTDNEHPEVVLKKMIKSHDLKPDILILYARKHYKMDVLDAVKQIVL